LLGRRDKPGSVVPGAECHHYVSGEAQEFSRSRHMLFREPAALRSGVLFEIREADENAGDDEGRNDSHQKSGEQRFLPEKIECEESGGPSRSGVLPGGFDGRGFFLGESREHVEGAVATQACALAPFEMQIPKIL